MTDDEKKATGEAAGKTETRKKGSGLRWLIYAAALVLIILTAAYLTIGVVISEAPAAASYPYTTTYQVQLPSSETVKVGNADILAIPIGDQVTLSINKEPRVMRVGETRTIQERRAHISVLSLGLMDFDFRVDATYQGQSGNSALFALAFKTSQQVPSFLIERLLPANVQARPV
ncbi:MAG TPA: hypothetical protein VMT31_05895 [Methanomicrobiales archaeon]|jgi:hypothetical protein|nr:hypothetical protein [Methanomicrobiales archaeon]